MIHIITTFFETDKWFDIQRGYIEKYTTGDYSILCGYYNVKLPLGNNNYVFYDLVKIINEHYKQVNFLANSVLLPDLNDEDIFIFMDCDTLPCEYGWDLKIIEYLKNHDVVAVVMKENKIGIDLYENLPHLCLFATTKKIWNQNNLEWKLEGSCNPQVGMKHKIEQANLKLKQLNRTNIFNAHRVCYGIYGDLIYHQTCAVRGFKNQVFEGVDIHQRSLSNNEVTLGDINTVNSQIWHIIWNAIYKDEKYNFVRKYFMGKE